MTASGGAVVAERLVARIRRQGPLPWSAFMDAALYDPDGGFYVTGGRAGRRGDFLTSPEVGPLFGLVLAGALDTWWHEQGRPDPYVVVDAGAGPGTLARTVLAARPACAPALRYVLVDVSAAQRDRHALHLPLQPATAAGLGADESSATVDGREGAAGAEGDGAGRARDVPVGPIVVSLGELPRVPAHVIVANELLDNLAIDIVTRRAGEWFEVRVAADGQSLVELLVPVTAARIRWCRAHVPHPTEGARVPVQQTAADWLGRALAGLVPGGRLVVVDYFATTAAIAARGAPVPRTYRAHRPGGHALDAPGTQDLTIDVALDQLAAVQAPSSVRTQAEFLAAHGLAERVTEGKRVWGERAAIGDLAALTARSRVAEAEALTDAAGLGAFTVAEWVAG